MKILSWGLQFMRCAFLICGLSVLAGSCSMVGTRTPLKDLEPSCESTIPSRELVATAALSGTRKVGAQSVMARTSVASRMRLEIEDGQGVLDMRSSALAQKGLNATNGPRVMEFASLEEAGQFGAARPQFANTGCAILLAKRQQVPFGGGTVTIEYSPPVPLFPNFQAPAPAIASEMEESRSWSGITAKIVASTAPGVRVGTTGNVRVTMSRLKSGKVRFDWAVDGVLPSRQGMFGLVPFGEFVPGPDRVPSRIFYPVLDGDQVVATMEYR